MTCGEAMDSDTFSVESTGGRSLILCYELIPSREIRGLISSQFVPPLCLSSLVEYTGKKMHKCCITHPYVVGTQGGYMQCGNATAMTLNYGNKPTCEKNTSAVSKWDYQMCHQWPRNKSAWSQFLFALLFNKVTIQTSSIRERWGGKNRRASHLSDLQPQKVLLVGPVCQSGAT